MSVAIASTLSLLSAIVVALLSHLFTIRRKRSDELAEMRLKAYTDFINATSRLVTARRAGKTEDELGELASLNDAKARIVLCGHKPVVEELVRFWNAGGTLEGENEVLAFTRFCLQIRESLGSERHDVVSLPISDTLFRLEPAAFSFRARQEGRDASKG